MSMRISRDDSMSAGPAALNAGSEFTGKVSSRIMVVDQIESTRSVQYRIPSTDPGARYYARLNFDF